jgi:hypothetical protein
MTGFGWVFEVVRTGNCNDKNHCRSFDCGFVFAQDDSFLFEVK